MSALPNSTGQPVETGVFLPAGAKAWEEIVRRFLVVRDRRGDLRAALIELGLALMEIQKRGVPHGAWESMLKAHGVPVNTSKSAMRAAKEHLGLIPMRRKDQRTEPEQSGTMVPKYSGDTERGLTDEELDEQSQFAGEEELASISEETANLMVAGLVPVGGKKQGGEAVVSTTVERGIAAVAGVAQENRLEEAAIAGRIGVRGLEARELPAARRSDVAGQMTLVGSFLDGINSRKAAIERLDGERMRAAQAVLAECNRKLDEILGEAA